MKRKSTYEAALAKLNGYIQENNLRHSPVREMVLEQACLLPQPFTAEQLAQACAPERISSATVYNNLSLFITAHILYAIDRQQGKNATLYEFTSGRQTRLQMICSSCGRVAEFRDKAIDHLIRVRKYPNFDLHRYSIFVYGECKHCLTANKKET